LTIYPNECVKGRHPAVKGRNVSNTVSYQRNKLCNLARHVSNNCVLILQRRQLTKRSRFSKHAKGSQKKLKCSKPYHHSSDMVIDLQLPNHRQNDRIRYFSHLYKHYISASDLINSLVWTCILPFCCIIRCAMNLRRLYVYFTSHVCRYVMCRPYRITIQYFIIHIRLLVQQLTKRNFAIELK